MSKAPMDIQERLMRRVERLPWSGCWIWMGYINRAGYGELYDPTYSGKKGAHRVSWEIAHKTQIPEGMFICHTCDIPSCINPSHLWLGTHRDNLIDAGKKGRLGWKGRRTHCIHGHVLSPTNIWTPPSANGGRVCKQCSIQRHKERRRRGQLA